MAEYKLYCFAQSGNAYRAALMLNLVGADWEPVWVDFFKGGVQRTPEFRGEVNEMGEAPVLVFGDRKLSQSGVILTYLSGKFKKFQPRGEDEQLECLRWILFDNQKVSGYLGPYRFIKTLSGKPDPGAMNFLKPRIDNALGIVNKRLVDRKFLIGDHATIADLSMCGYMYYPPDEFGFDIASDYPAIGTWLDRIKAL
ncbi:MAG TPA: glutathione S-transferase, partial [Xanthobacteraceae bacterium]|nr:glutathione S-transferase [Xanthobacteraceae bacterium]